MIFQSCFNEQLGYLKHSDTKQGKAVNIIIKVKWENHADEYRMQIGLLEGNKAWAEQILKMLNQLNMGENFWIFLQNPN